MYVCVWMGAARWLFGRVHRIGKDGVLQTEVVCNIWMSDREVWGVSDDRATVCNSVLVWLSSVPHYPKLGITNPLLEARQGHRAKCFLCFLPRHPVQACILVTLCLLLYRLCSFSINYQIPIILLQTLFNCFYSREMKECSLVQHPLVGIVLPLSQADMNYSFKLVLKGHLQGHFK